MNGTPTLIPQVIDRYSFKPGHGLREKGDDYRSVLNIPNLKPDHRFIVCKDQIQVIHQRFRGNRWRPLSYFTSESGLNRGLSLALASDGVGVPEQQEGPEATVSVSYSSILQLEGVSA